MATVPVPQRGSTPAPISPYEPEWDCPWWSEEWLWRHPEFPLAKRAAAQIHGSGEEE